MDLQVVTFRQSVEHLRGAYGFDYTAAQPAVVNEIFEQKRHNAVRIDKGRLRKVVSWVHGADAVGVAIGCQADLVLAGGHFIDKRLQVAPNWFGMAAVKARVHFAT